MKRVWTRAEQMAFFCKRGISNMFLVSSPGSLHKVADDWMNDVVNIFRGDMTCCALKHEGGSKCDRESLASPLLGMYFDMYTLHKADKMNEHEQAAWRFIEPRKSEVFPGLYDYVTPKGTFISKDLFGSMISRIERFVDTDVQAALKMSSGSTSETITVHLAAHKKESLEVPDFCSRCVGPQLPPVNNRYLM